jgi:predicted hotdog family 3-hydroxylacyl-ACP dehydratase
MFTPPPNTPDLIPQKFPFVMIDHLIYSDDKSSRSNFCVKADNILVEDGEFSASGLVENIAQTAAARAGYIALDGTKADAIGYIGAIKNLEVFSLPKINDILETEIIIDNQIFDVTLISGTVKRGDEILAKCQMKVFVIQQQQIN